MFLLSLSRQEPVRIFIVPLVSDVKKMKMMTGRWDLKFNVGVMFLS
jgi:hypothetical protein